ncbi:peptide ABC transporter substrate-binding protein [Microbulbifer guangxiensis]|uniref:peptide ABC transporter substrate-binding protein n=1 Tax=Microbulbifer guangxiensis TaxID=2904249 RepID=UPI001F2FDAD7|nr:peptide ABC transporter substrate-binding protein [Microbulbifer guangxiensis]
MNRHHAHESSIQRYWLALACSLALLSGCERNDPSSLDQPHNTAEPDQPKNRQELVRGNYSGPFSLDPHHAIGMDPNIIRDLFEGLVAAAPGGGIRAAAASNWEMPDSKTYVFHLRPTARWSNGDQVTANDFVYSWQRLVDPATASPHGSYLSDIKVLNAARISRGELPVENLGIRAIDSHTLEISLESPVSYFLQTLVDSATYPVHEETISRYGESWTSAGNLVGNGAFTLDIWRINERVELARNPLYWDFSNVRLNRVTFLPIASESAELNRYLAGEIDITAGIPTSMISSLRQERHEEIVMYPTLQTKILEINTAKKPLDNVKVRRALALAIDRDLITEKLWQRGDIPAYSLVPPNASRRRLFTPDWSEWPQSRREEESRNLLTEAGYSKDSPLRFSFSYISSSHNKKMALALAAMWQKALPVEVDFKNTDGKALMEDIKNGDFNLFSSGLHATYNEPSGMLNGFLSTAGLNLTGFNNPDYDRVLQLSTGKQDTNDRQAQYAMAEQILSEDMPAIPLYHKTEAVLVKPHVRGYEPNMIGHVYSRDLWVEPRQH